MERVLSGVLFTSVLMIYSHGNTPQDKLERIGLNPVTSAVPFLIIAPDAKSGGMGELGVATPPDFASLHWNIGKAVFLPQDFIVSISYTPWFRNITPDMFLAYVSVFDKMKDKMSIIGGSLRYFSLGSVTFTDEYGTVIREFKPYEFAIDFGYSRMLSGKWGGGIAIRYIYSNLTGNLFLNGAQTKPGQTAAVDVGAFYKNTDIKLWGKSLELRWGIQLANIGAKITYSSSAQKDFLPAMFRTGISPTLRFDATNSLTYALEISKMMVPTPPIYDTSAGTPPPILKGMDPNRSVANALITSWYDAPGGLQEELREFNIATGIEYWYANQIAFRTGFFWEHSTKGNRRFVNLGATITYSTLQFHVSYLIPVFQEKLLGSAQLSPLANTIRFSLIFNFASQEKKEEGRKE